MKNTNARQEKTREGKMITIKSGMLDWCYCLPENLNRVLDNYKSKYKTGLVLPIGKKINIREKEVKRVIGYRKNNGEFFVLVNFYEKVKGGAA